MKKKVNIVIIANTIVNAIHCRLLNKQENADHNVCNLIEAITPKVKSLFVPKPPPLIAVDNNFVKESNVSSS